jgi:hypothetical protein
MEDTETDTPGHRKWRALHVPVKDADNEVEPGIQTVTNKMHKGDFVVCSRVSRFFDEVGTYAWDKKAQDRGIDKPIKKDDHALDMVRYSLHTRRNHYDAYAGWAA